MQAGLLRSRSLEFASYAGQTRDTDSRRVSVQKNGSLWPTLVGRRSYWCALPRELVLSLAGRHTDQHANIAMQAVKMIGGMGRSEKTGCSAQAPSHTRKSVGPDIFHLGCIEPSIESTPVHRAVSPEAPKRRSKHRPVRLKAISEKPSVSLSSQVTR
jgi:hypothetical protein